MTILCKEEHELVHSHTIKSPNISQQLRYSVLPDVTRFFKRHSKVSLILDNGCGNGKNCNKRPVFIGTDTINS